MPSRALPRSAPQEFKVCDLGRRGGRGGRASAGCPLRVLGGEPHPRAVRAPEGPLLHAAGRGVGWAWLLARPAPVPRRARGLLFEEQVKAAPRLGHSRLTRCIFFFFSDLFTCQHEQGAGGRETPKDSH